MTYKGIVRQIVEGEFWVEADNQDEAEELLRKEANTYLELYMSIQSPDEYEIVSIEEEEE